MNSRFNLMDDLARLPIWQGKPAFEPLEGGLSNISFLATDAGGRYVTRLTRDFPFHDVYRSRELAVARAAYEAGFAPEIVHAAPGLMVSRYLEAQPLTPLTMRLNADRIVPLLQRFHREMRVASPFRFDLFAIIRDYIRQLDGHEPGDRLSAWSATSERLAAMVPHLPDLFGHNDMMPGNILDDGKRLWLIDFEYSGRSSPLFDLANLAANGEFSATESADLLRAYFGSADLLRAQRAMVAASLLREGLWSLVSALFIHKRDIDYRGYANANFARLDQHLGNF